MHHQVQPSFSARSFASISHPRRKFQTNISIILNMPTLYGSYQPIAGSAGNNTSPIYVPSLAPSSDACPGTITLGLNPAQSATVTMAPLCSSNVTSSADAGQLDNAAPKTRSSNTLSEDVSHTTTSATPLISSSNAAGATTAQNDESTPPHLHHSHHSHHAT